MARPTIHLEWAEHVTCELEAGVVFVHQCELPLHQACELVVSNAGRDLRLEAVVVFTDGEGAGLELLGYGPDLKAQVAEFNTTAAELARAFEAFDQLDELAAAAGAYEDPPDLDLDVAVRFTAPAPLDDAPSSDPDEPLVAQPADLEPVASEPEPRRGYRISSPSLGVRAALHGVEVPAPDDQPSVRDPDSDVRVPDERDETRPEPAPESDGEGDGTPERKALMMHERLRRLTIREQLKKAHSSDPSERILLERIYGKNVWEALLRNPRLTAPEVVRLARMGTLPRPLLELIVANGGWLQIPEVRRALLSNPRLGTDQILRVLRLLPKHELKVASTTTAYPFAVRDAAKRMARDD